MTIKVLGTGSKGNCYIITSKSGQKLILECGISYYKIIKEIENVSDIKCVLISHSHTDHDCKMGKVRCSDKFKQSLIPIYSPENLNIGTMYIQDDFIFVPLPCKHNVECYGYYIEVDGKKILFATDTQVIPRINIECDYYLLEVNYQMEILENMMYYLQTKNDEEDIQKLIHYQNVYNNHSALETVMDYLESNIKHQPKGIYAIHGSNSGFIIDEEVEEELYKYCNNVKILKEGDVIEC